MRWVTLVETPNKNYVRNALLIGIGAFIIVVIVVWWRFGAQGIVIMLQKIILYTLILAAIGAVLALVYWLFKTQRLDMVHIHHQRLVNTCEANSPPFKQQLWFRSEDDNWATRYVGDIVGMCMIQAAPKRQAVKKGYETTLTVANPEKGYEKIVFIAFRSPGFFNRWFPKLFGQTDLIMGTPDDFSPLSASLVFMRGLTFAPPLYDILTLAHHWERRHFIDETIKENIYRYTLQENLKEIATMIDDAIDASPSHKKKQETQLIQQVPIPGGQQKQ